MFQKKQRSVTFETEEEMDNVPGRENCRLTSIKPTKYYFDTSQVN
jgi:hypothetical protein